MLSMLTSDLESIMIEAQQRGWSERTTREVIEQFRLEFLRDPDSFADLLGVLE